MQGVEVGTVVAVEVGGSGVAVGPPGVCVGAIVAVLVGVRVAVDVNVACGVDVTVAVGLGLPIARTIAEVHGGRLWCEATPGGGSLFTLALPLQTDR